MGCDLITLRVRKTPVEVSVWFVGMAALCFFAGTARQICLGLCFAALHEAGHLAVMALCGAKPRRLCLTAAGMRIERPAELRLSFPQEIAAALAGPAVSLALAGLFFCAGRALPGLWLLEQGLWLNLGFGLFNLLPARQLDGGRALYFILCRFLPEGHARRAGAAASFCCLFLAALLAGTALLRGDAPWSLLIVLGYLAICC
ncbi:MAG: hypothetical protein FWH26_04670 [Oscillospiraceae bacterium]|nr:hypothetical protein [Oscillospiraceae bacterium]